MSTFPHLLAISASGLYRMTVYPSTLPFVKRKNHAEKRIPFSIIPLYLTLYNYVSICSRHVLHSRSLNNFWNHNSIKVDFLSDSKCLQRKCHRITIMMYIAHHRRCIWYARRLGRCLYWNIYILAILYWYKFMLLLFWSLLATVQHGSL